MSSPTRVATVAQIRAIEQACFKTTQSFAVMQQAGAAVAKEITEAPVLCVAGPGNNGGDALIVATLLHAQGMEVAVWLPLGKPKPGTDAAIAYKNLGEVKQVNQPTLAKYACIVDGLFGIGLARKLNATATKVIKQINAATATVIAIDVPSGVDADSGGVASVAVRASSTVTFFTHKFGLLTGAGKAHAGKVIVTTLGQKKLCTTVGGVCINRSTVKLVRNQDAHKGSCGTVAIVGGHPGMGGALVLASRAAVAHGCGKVFAVGADDKLPAYDPLAPEVMWRRELPPKLTAIAFGVGAGTLPATANRLRVVLEKNLPTVIDADGLNLLANYEFLRQALAKHKAPKILTPHVAEAARLLEAPVDKIIANRVESACALAVKFNAVVVLKGSGSVVATPTGKFGIVASGNPALAQAGSGDVLTGIIAAFLAQGCNAWDAAASGAYLHGAGADVAAVAHGGVIGVPLDKITTASTQVLNQQLNDAN